jgi:hypothetical protein
MLKKVFLASTVALMLALPVMAQEKVVAKDDGLNHFILIWTITTTEQVEDQAQDDPYHPGKKLPVSGKKHSETRRLVCAKEFKSKAEAEKFMASAPADVKKHCHLLSEDE